MSELISIRPLEHFDMPAVLGMWHALMKVGAEADERFVLAENAVDEVRAYAMDMWTRRNPFPHGFVAQRGERLVGMVLGVPLRSIPVIVGPSIAQISDIWVAPSARREGLGRKLVARFHESCRDAGYSGLEVRTLVNDKRAVDFWRGIGFEDWMISFRLGSPGLAVDGDGAGLE